MIGHFLDDVVDFGLAIDVAAHEVLAAADKLLVIEFIQTVEVKRTHLLEQSCLHTIISSPNQEKCRSHLSILRTRSYS
jgi:hypothetical protein